MSEPVTETGLGKRALITGVTGQDGSYLAERLLAAGVEVHGVVHEDTAEQPATAGVVVHTGDLGDAGPLRALITDLVPDRIFNLGGISSVALSWDEPGMTARLSGVAPLELMDAALAAQDASGQEIHFVQATSAEIFGDPATSPQNEETPVAPVSPYGVAKAMAHHGTRVYRSRGLHATSCILYNHESPRRPPRFVTRKITRSVAEIARGDRERLTLGNLDARRDWGWAPDYVEAMVRAAAHPEPSDYVIATGTAHSVREFVAAAFARVGITDWEGLVDVDAALVRPADAAEQRGDPSRARERLGWVPTVGFDELVGRMVDADLDT